MVTFNYTLLLLGSLAEANKGSVHSEGKQK